MTSKGKGKVKATISTICAFWVEKSLSFLLPLLSIIITVYKTLVTCIVVAQLLSAERRNGKLARIHLTTFRLHYTNQIQIHQ